MAKTRAFDDYVTKYDNWFVINEFAFKSELNAVKRMIPYVSGFIEIGIGSGIFAEPMGIREGLDPSETMREKAGQRSLKVLDVDGKRLFTA